MDVWAIGCMLDEMLNGSRPLFRGDSEICHLMHIFKVSVSEALALSKCCDFQASFPKCVRGPTLPAQTTSCSIGSRGSPQSRRCATRGCRRSHSDIARVRPL